MIKSELYSSLVSLNGNNRETKLIGNPPPK